MIKAIFALRVKQIGRELYSAGLFRLLILLVLVGFVGFYLYIKSADAVMSRYLAIGMLLLLLSVHFKRGDKAFLKMQFSHYKYIYFAEYGILSLPIACSLALQGQFVPLMILLIGIWLIVQIDVKPKTSSLNTRLQETLPNTCFEWKAGVRKQMLILVPVWGVGLCTSFFIGSVPVAIFIIGVVTLGFYEENESLPMLTSRELGAKKLLWDKLKTYILLFTIVLAPLIGAFMVFHHLYGYIPLIEYVIFVSLAAYTLMVKYAFYRPHTKTSAAQVYIGIGVLGAFVPILLPVVWVLTLWFYVKSVHNLDFYLNDYNR